VLGCGEPTDVIKSLDVGIAILWTKGIEPGDAMDPVELPGRHGSHPFALSRLGARREVQELLVEEVFPAFPGELRFVDWDQRRWADERKERTAAIRQAIRLVD
jgi:hypothetical protein